MIATNPEIRAFMAANDPKALAQVDEAVAEADAEEAALSAHMDETDDEGMGWWEVEVEMEARAEANMMRAMYTSDPQGAREWDNAVTTGQG